MSISHSTPSSVTVWRLRSGADRRFRAGHPWVYSNELAESPKGLEPGSPVELRDVAGKFLARGYGNPHSLIAFRALSRDPVLLHPMDPENVLATLLSAGKLREQLGLREFSHRLCFGESDGLPGLVVDRFRTGSDSQVLVVQMHTAGVDRLKGELLRILENYVQRSQGAVSWSGTTVVLRNDLGVRKLEGLEEEVPAVLREGAPKLELELEKSLIWVRPVGGAVGPEDRIEFSVDLLGGQKTGFFLDQGANVELAAQRLAFLRPAPGTRLRVLDLCCYVGQWGTQLSRFFKKQGLEVEVLSVDASAQALERAKRNVEAQGAICETLKTDVLKGLETLPSASFDLVISDPPALIKNRKDIPAGTHAYLQLNTQVFRLVRKGGGVVSCSCSALLDEESFVQTLTKAAARNHRRMRWVGRGMPAPDHPLLTEFPEGRYLKAWIGIDAEA